jgi:intermediate cleaving peptidase 55
VPVVAGGNNGLILHYVNNTGTLSAGKMVLVDAGGEYEGYASDITRTWPVSGKFTAAQRDVYQLVLDTEMRVAERARPGVSLESLQDTTSRLLHDGMQQLLGRRVGALEFNDLYPHHVSHYIGMDVHDTPSISRYTPLKPGNCFTIEPGLYIPDREEYGALRGISVRVEDDFCCTQDGVQCLTAEAPKHIDDVEALILGLTMPYRQR